MAYVINKFNGEQLLVLEDGTIDTSTSLGLVGRNYVGYGETQNENFVYLLENFANNAPPSRPLKGQIWFNTTNNTAYTYNGTDWGPIGAAALSETAPIDPTPGSLWLKTPDNVLYVWLGATWRFIGPESVSGFGSTRARSTTLNNQDNVPKPVIFLETNGIPLAICTAETFTLHPDFYVSDFETTLVAGINLSNTAKINGSVTGNAGSADRLSTPRTINGITFDGSQNVTIKASTTRSLVKGDYIVGNNFDGSNQVTWSVDATSSNVIGKVVVRNSEGGFSAGTISAKFEGDLTGNVTATTGVSKFNTVEATRFIGATLSGNANSATRLESARKINDVAFDGTRDITVPAAAETLTGNRLNPTVTESSLQVVGNLVNLTVSNPGIAIGSGNQIKLLVDSSSNAIIRSTNGKLKFDMVGLGPDVSFVDAGTSLSLGGPDAPAITGDNLTNIGLDAYRFNNIYANYFRGLDAQVQTISPKTAGGSITANGNLVVTGDLTVQGNVTAVNSTELTIEDKLITLASGAATAIEANGAGIFINGSGASLTYASSGNKWVLNKLLDMGINDVVTNGLFRGTATSAQYADLAENYLADAEYSAGTVLEIGGTQEVTLAQVESNRLAGVVSTNPAYLMNSECKGLYVVPVALQGRVPCKVTGKIKKGDMLVSAGNGYAKAAINPQIGTVLGKSLEDFDGDQGLIEILAGRI